MTMTDATTELGTGTFETMTATATRRLVRTAVLIGLVTVLGSCAVAYLAYSASRENVLRSLQEKHLYVAAGIRDHLARTASGPTAPGEEMYRGVVRYWELAEQRGELSIVRSPGTVVFHSDRPELVGQEVFDVPIQVDDPGPAEATWQEVFVERRDWTGRARFQGSRQLLSAAYLEPADAFVTVHLPISVVDRQLIASALPWGLGIVGVAGLLVPLAMHLLYRSYRVAQQAALAASSARRQSEIRYRDLYNKTPVMMYSVDGDENIVKVNDHWLNTMGYRRDEVLGRKPSEFLTPRSREFAETKAMPRFFKQGHCQDVPHELVTRDGRVLKVLLSATLERDEEGNLTKARATLVDVTAVKRAEAERDEKLRQLEEKNKELEQFTYTVSHDLKSPLVTIKGFLGFVEKDAAAGDLERLRSDLARIDDAAEKMKRLLDELLELSRVGRMTNPPEDISLGELAREAASLVEGALAERGGEIEIADDLPTVRVDRVRLVQVFQNLLENAIKFTADTAAPRIRVGARDDGGREVFFVEDNGMGIEERYLQKIFGLFEKMSSSGEGTGIGLALVRRIIEFHDGKIWAESAGPGHGATFCFTLAEARDTITKELHG